MKIFLLFFDVLNAKNAPPQYKTVKKGFFF